MRSTEEILLGFTTALRAAGVEVTPDRAAGFLAATAILGADDPAATYQAGRATLCAGPTDLERYAQVFEAWFGTREVVPRAAPRVLPRRVESPLPIDDGAGSGGQDVPEAVHASASALEVLRHRDVADLSVDQKALLNVLLAGLRPRSPRRRAARRTPWRRGEVDLHQTLRGTLRRLGEPGPVTHRRRGWRPRRVVLLVDVSGSMRPYADTLLRLAQVVVRSAPPGGRPEVFTLGTRLTRVTTALRLPDPERALVRAGEQVPDWSGGTRLGETLKVFLDRWGARGMARGAVVVVFSDGWERGDASGLGEQMARLRRLAHRVYWVNPHRGKPGYEPVQAGIVAVVPHLDGLLAGHSVRTFEEVLEMVADA